MVHTHNRVLYSFKKCNKEDGFEPILKDSQEILLGEKVRPPKHLYHTVLQVRKKRMLKNTQVCSHSCRETAYVQNR